MLLHCIHMSCIDAVSVVSTSVLENGPALFLPLVVHSGACNLTEELQTLGVRGQRQLVDLRERERERGREREGEREGKREREC